MNPTYKLALLEALLAFKTGQLATVDTYEYFSGLVNDLVQQSPPLDLATQAPLLTGNWQLLYTNRATFSPLENLPGFQLGRVFQYICAEEQWVVNLAELVGPADIVAIVGIQASFRLVSPVRLSVQFERAWLTSTWGVTGTQVSNWITQLRANLALALGLEIKQTGWLEIRYVDDTLRIGVGNEGNLFILKRVED